MTSGSGSDRPSPRRPGPARTAGGDHHQEVIQRRLIAAVAAIVFLALILFMAKGCASARKERGIEKFIDETTSIISLSNQDSSDFFGLLRTPGEAGVTEIETSINERRSQAADLVQRARKLDTPGDLKSARRFLVLTLEFRRDGLTRISELIPQALGDQDPETATERIAAEMQNFLAGDVVYSQRAYAYMESAVKKNRIEGKKIPASRFLPSLEWLDPAVVDDVLSRARGSGGSDAPVAPGLHGTGITGVAASPSGTALTAGGANALGDAKSIAIDIQNQGEHAETGVVVSLQISGAGTPIRLQDTISKIAAGETKKVTIPLTRTPAEGSSATLKIEVRRVPGEENTDNNRQSFSVKF